MRWVRQTNFANDEAVGYLADRLARLGVEDVLAGMGAAPGALVTIGAVTFDWQPSTPAGIAGVLTGRGTDPRLDQSSRVAASERKVARAVRRSPGATDAGSTDPGAGDAGEEERQR